MREKRRAGIDGGELLQRRERARRIQEAVGRRQEFGGLRAERGERGERVGTAVIGVPGVAFVGLPHGGKRRLEAGVANPRQRDGGAVATVSPR